MLNVTPAMRDHLVKTFALKAEATDDEARKLVGEKLASGELAADKLAELCKTGASEKAAELSDLIATKTAEAVAKAMAAHKPAEVVTPAAKQDVDIAEFEKRLKEIQAGFEKKMEEVMKANPAPKAHSILALGADLDKNDSDVNIRVKGVLERYDSTTKAATRNRIKGSLGRDEVITYRGRDLNVPSEVRKAMAMVWFKYQVAPEYLNEREETILLYILHKEKFIVNSDAVNDSDSVEPRLLTGEEIHKMKLQKANVPLIADNTTGGNYATPEFFDSEFILLPVLGNELAPLCNIKDVARGSAAAGFTMGNPSLAAHVEAANYTAFDNTSFIANHDTTFFRAMGATEIGLNFLQDATPGMADEIIGRYVAKGAEWVDEQVAIGDGTTEPQGIFSASGTTDVTFTTPTTGPYVITDVLNLLFGVTKAYRQAFPSSKAAFVMTDTAYKKLRQIATGVTGDTRLIFGEDVESYRLFGHPVAIVGTGLTNDQLAFVQCGGYRLYRRQGMRFRRETAGSTLALHNSMLIVGDMRYGGQLDRGGYAAVATSGIP